MAGWVGGGGLVGAGAFVGGGGLVGITICGVGDRKRVAICNVGNCAVGKPPLSCVGKNGVIPSGVTLGKKPKGVGVAGRGVAVTTCGPFRVAVAVAGVGVRCGAVPHRKNPAQ